MANVLLFGDSITFGAWDNKGGWAQRIKSDLDQENPTRTDYYRLVYNLGISGNTTEDVLKRFEFETKQRVQEDDETIIIFAIGINSSQFMHDKNDLRYSLDEFQNHIKELIKLARKYTSKIVFIGLNPVDDSKVDPLPWDTNKSYKNEDVEKFNNIVKSVCNDNKIHFVEIYEKFIMGGYKSLLEDGIHPNTEGHKKIYNLVNSYLRKNKVID